MQVREFRCLGRILVNKVNFSQLSKMRSFLDSFIPFAALGVLVSWWSSLRSWRLRGLISLIVNCAVAAASLRLINLLALR